MLAASATTRTPHPSTVVIKIATRLLPREIAFKNRIKVAKRSADDSHVLAVLERPPGNLHYSVPAAGANVIDDSLRNGEHLAARRYEADNSRHVANLEIVRDKPKPGKQVLRK
jgi:hypothetical protein